MHVTIKSFILLPGKVHTSISENLALRGQLYQFIMLITVTVPISLFVDHSVVRKVQENCNQLSLPWECQFLTDLETLG